MAARKHIDVPPKPVFKGRAPRTAAPSSKPESAASPSKAARSPAKAVAPRSTAKPVRAKADPEPKAAATARASKPSAAERAPKAPAGSRKVRGAKAEAAPKVELRPVKEAGGVSSEAVARRTGKSWAEWFNLLDNAGAEKLAHKNVVAILAQRHGVGPWWQQMITVAYEQARGKREKHETPEGYQVGATKTLLVPLPRLYRLWLEPSERDKWLADARFTIHKATSGKSIRARWGRGSSRIDVYFSDKGAGKSEVNVQHNKIDGSGAAQQMKAYWAKKLGALEKLLSDG